MRAVSRTGLPRYVSAFLLYLCLYVMRPTAGFGQQQPYPLVLSYDKSAYRAFIKSYEAFKKKYKFNYLRETIDSVGCTIGQLAYAAQPIQLPLEKYLTEADTTAAILKALREFIDEHSTLLNTTVRDIVLASLREVENAIVVKFERATYGKMRAGGKTRGQLEFVINRKGEIAVLICTATRLLTGLPQKAKVSVDKIYKMLLGKKLRFIVDEKHVQYEIDRIDVIKPALLCVYEDKEVHVETLKNGETELHLKRAKVHLAYEVEIDIKYKKPIARIYIDAITGEELATEYPFLEEN
jgi:hypothetical protein